MATINKSNNLWEDLNILETVKRMDPAQMYRYQKMTSEMIKKASDPNPHANTIEAATQVRLLLRDGLCPELLSEEERNVFVEVYGKEALKQFEYNSHVDNTV